MADINDVNNWLGRSNWTADSSFEGSFDEFRIYDLNGDGKVDSGDQNHWVSNLMTTWFGDADLNGEFNSGDLVVVLASGTYEMDVDSGWATGDFDGDGRTNSSDLVAALSDGGYELGPRAAVASVPEPAAVTLLISGMLCSLWVRARER